MACDLFQICYLIAVLLLQDLVWIMIINLQVDSSPAKHELEWCECSRLVYRSIVGIHTSVDEFIPHFLLFTCEIPFIVLKVGVAVFMTWTIEIIVRTNWNAIALSRTSRLLT